MKSFSLTLRKHLVKSLVWSTLLYGAETWVIRKEDARRLERCDMWLRQNLLGISWADKVCNKEVLTWVEERQQVLDIIWQLLLWKGESKARGPQDEEE